MIAGTKNYASNGNGEVYENWNIMATPEVRNWNTRMLYGIFGDYRDKFFAGFHRIRMYLIK